MTSNIGAETFKKQGSLGFKTDKEEMTYQTMKAKLLDEVKKTFKPEFINRVDDIIVFRPLTKEDLYKIVDLEVAEVKDRLKEQHEIIIDLSKEATDFLIEKGFDPVYGARPIKRTIQRFLEDPLAEEIISARIKRGRTVKVSAKVDHLIFE
jgi:ATP-dependent Clp protease ATP-binding subunit ClpC